MKNPLLVISNLFRRWRLLPIILITLPLLLPPVVLLTAVGSYIRLLEVSDWTRLSLREMLRVQRRQCLDALRPDLYPQPNPHVPVLNLHLSGASLDLLNASLPLSGFNEKPATIETASGPQKVDVRYRGDSNFHWIYPKKSWNIKTSRREPLFFGRRLALVNPKDSEYITQYASSRVADRFELLTSLCEMVVLSVNGQYQGVYTLLQPTDESFLRTRGQMPGDTWEGDPSHQAGIPGEFFGNPYIWRKASEYNGPPPWEEHPLEQLVRQINERTYWNQNRRLMNEEYMARFLAFVTLIGTGHYNDVHNLKLFLDPLSGQFQMIEWDSTGFTLYNAAGDSTPVDIASNRLFLELLLNPVFNYQKNRCLYDQLETPGFVEDFQREIFQAAAAIAPYVDGDKLDRYGQNFGNPHGVESFPAMIEVFNKVFAERAAWVKNQIETSAAEYAFQNETLKLDVSGYAPIRAVYLTLDAPPPSNLDILRDANLNGRYDSDTDRSAAWSMTEGRTLRIEEWMFPGRSVGSNTPPGALRPGPLSYVFLFRNAENLRILSIEAENAMTGERMPLRNHNDWTIAASDSLHPWQNPILETEVKRLARKEAPRSGAALPITRETARVIRPPRWHVEQNVVIPEDETLILEAGVEVLLDPGVSILSYGRVDSRGTAENPVVFRRANPAAPWGVIALQGSGANRSIFRHTVFEGGSDANLHNTYYCGMVSAYYVEPIRFEHCRFRDNVIGDDMLRAAKSTAEVLHCEFENAWGDAIDFDYTQGVIRNCVFRNTGNDAIDLMTSDPIIQGNRMDGAGDKGISIGEQSHPIIFDCDIRNAHIGIEIKDGSEPIIAGCHIHGLEYGIHQYSKNWRYADGGHAKIYNSIITCEAALLRQDAWSDLQIYASVLKGGAASEIVPESLALVDCLAGEEAKRALEDGSAEAHRRKESLISRFGWEHELRIPEKIFSDRFHEDFTTNIGDWTPNEHVRRARKNRNRLELRAMPGKRAVLARPIPAQEKDAEAAPSEGLLLMEARAPRLRPDIADREVRLKIAFAWSGNPQKTLAAEASLSNAMRQFAFPVPLHEPPDRVEIQLPAGGEHVEVRKIELIVIPRTVNR